MKMSQVVAAMFVSFFLGASLIVATLDGPNESSLEIQIKDGKVVRTGHDMGSGLDTWIDGFDIAP